MLRTIFNSIVLGAGIAIGWHTSPGIVPIALAVGSVVLLSALPKWLHLGIKSVFKWAFHAMTEKINSGELDGLSEKEFLRKTRSLKDRAEEYQEDQGLLEFLGLTDENKALLDALEQAEKRRQTATEPVPVEEVEHLKSVVETLDEQVSALEQATEEDSDHVYDCMKFKLRWIHGSYHVFDADTDRILNNVTTLSVDDGKVSFTASFDFDPSVGGDDLIEIPAYTSVRINDNGAIDLIEEVSDH